MSIEYKVRCFCPGCDEELAVNTSPFRFLPPFTLQIAQPGKLLPLNKVDCNRSCTISLLKDSRVCLFHMCVNMCVRMCVHGSLPVLYQYLIQEALPFSSSPPTTIVPTRTYADLLYKTFQLKTLAPPINLTRLSMCFSLVPIPAEKTKNGFYACSPEGGCESEPLTISVIPCTMECICASVTCIYCRLWLSMLSFKKRI